MSLKKNTERRERRTRYRIRNRNRGDRARLSVLRTNKNIGGQIIDPEGKVLISFSSLSKGMVDKVKGKQGAEIASIIGEELGKIALKSGVREVVFDKGPYTYIGRVKAFADGCRKAGLVF